MTDAELAEPGSWHAAAAGRTIADRFGLPWIGAAGGGK
jgi:hypothetical protein